MAQGNPILVMDFQDDAKRLKIEYIDEDNIPQMLNGESGFHCYHVRMLTEFILRELCEYDSSCTLSDSEISAIAIASSLHDIGKEQIPQSILDFPGRLSPVEYDIVKKHSVFGENIIKEAVADDIDPLVVKFATEIARSHHERFDGSGYPDGLKGNNIPISAQAVAIADSYDALTSSRSYKQAFSQDVAVQMISSGMCGVFSEAMIECLLRVVNRRELISIREKLTKSGAVISEYSRLAPERVLCIGNTEYLTKEFIDETFPESKVMVVGNTELGSAEKIKLFKIKKPSIKAIFETYEFDFVVYFSGDLTFRTTEKNDSEELREVLECAKELQKDVKILYLSSLDSSFLQKTDRSILSSAKELMCDYYETNHSLDIKIMQIPYLYSGVLQKDFLYKIFEQIYNGDTVNIEEKSSDRMHFMSLSDLSDLIFRIIENWQTGSGILTVRDEFNQKFSDLAEKLKTLETDVNVDFIPDEGSEEIALNNKALRNEYGWFAKISIIEDLQEQYEIYTATKVPKEETLWDKIKNFFAKHSLLVKTVELFLLFFVTELFLHSTDSAVIFSIVDFRTVYVVIMATVHGLYFGIASAALSSLSWFVAKVMSGTDPLTIFYEPTNWLAFVFFFLVGAVCGYVKLRKDDKIRFAVQQSQLLEDKLVFTREIYEDTLREKRDLKKQIIGSKDSFGKIFDITRKLNTVEPQLLYLRIMETFEDVLENKGITVYSVNGDSTFGRLEVASRDIIDSVSRSVSTETYAPIIEQLNEGEIWRNTDLLPEFPMYAAGVYRGGKLVLLIFLWHADIDQRSLYYVNLFKILRDLVQMSLLRAFDYNQAIYDEQYISNTHIMNVAAFDDCLENFVALSEKKVSSYILLEVDCKGLGVCEADAILSKKVRANDIIGASENGTLRILFSQASEKDLEFILPRFEGLGFDISILH